MHQQATSDAAGPALAPGETSIDARWLAIFEDRYGIGSYRRLLALFGRPCVTFAEIAARFGVTRERVRQWHLQLLPDAPRGHARQRLCVVYNQKRLLLTDSLFRSFYQHARPYFAPGRIQLIPTRDGFRRRSVRLDGRTVAIMSARQHARLRQQPGHVAYILTRSSRLVDFVYYRLTQADYLLLPASAVPAERTTFLDIATSKYRRFKNTFEALPAEGIGPSSGV
jgi:hypothetical protein